MPSKLTDQPVTLCRSCGEQVRYLPINGGRKIFPHGVDHRPHECQSPAPVKVYTREEIREFEEKRRKEAP